MKIDPTFYRVQVSDGASAAALILIAYNLDAGKRFLGIEFYQLTSCFDNSQLSIPSGRQATFREALRVLGQSADAEAIARTQEVSRIESKVKEAYGASASVQIQSVG